jgi:hypothetical protein
MAPEDRTLMMVTCPGCRAQITFDQPYAYHAGFGNQGFLYNEAGTLTLVWSTFDPAFDVLAGDRNHPWMLMPEVQTRIEAALAPSPAGDCWLFANPARCPSCAHPIRGSILTDIYFLVYPGSVLTESTDGGHGFASALL